VGFNPDLAGHENVYLNGAVRRFCDRAMLIEDCRIVAQGSAEEIATRYTGLYIPQTAAAPHVQEKRPAKATCATPRSPCPPCSAKKPA